MRCLLSHATYVTQSAVRGCLLWASGLPSNGDMFEVYEVLISPGSAVHLGRPLGGQVACKSTKGALAAWGKGRDRGSAYCRSPSSVDSIYS